MNEAKEESGVNDCLMIVHRRSGARDTLQGSSLLDRARLVCFPVLAGEKNSQTGDKKANKDSASDENNGPLLFFGLLAAWSRQRRRMLFPLASPPSLSLFPADTKTINSPAR